MQEQKGAYVPHSHKLTFLYFFLLVFLSRFIYLVYRDFHLFIRSSVTRISFICLYFIKSILIVSFQCKRLYSGDRLSQAEVQQ